MGKILIMTNIHIIFNFPIFTNVNLTITNIKK